MQTTEPDMISPDRAEPRAMIFHATRALVEREGIENLTLGKVANEAQLPRPVVYGQFIRMEDLLLCVAADSVSTLARTIGGINWTPDELKAEEMREGAVILTLPRPEPSQEAPESMLELAREVSAALGTSSEAGNVLAATGSDSRVARRSERSRASDSVDESSQRDEVAVNLPVIDETNASLVDSIAPKPTTTELNSLLERRLCIFERALTALEVRQEQIEKYCRAAVASETDTVSGIVTKLGELVSRLDEAETRQKNVANDLRAALNEASVRIQTVESVARAALVENESVPAVVAPDQLELPPMPESIVNNALVSETQETALVRPDAPASFLVNARASAMAGGPARIQVDDSTKKPMRDNNMRYVAAGLVVTAIFVAAAGVAFSQGVRDGRNEASQNVATASPARALTNTAVTTSLDRLTASAERGNASAELAVATKYLNEAKSGRDPIAGFRWMTRAAVHGNAIAQYTLGTLYQQGIGTPPNAATSMRWYQAAAAQGNRKAMHNLAVAYAEGLGGVKSPSEAVRWLSRAANLGYVDSQFDLAVLYERGDGVPLSLLDAYKWYAIASAQGDSESKSRIEALRTQLTADDLGAAQHAADTFRPLPYNAAANLQPRI